MKKKIIIDNNILDFETEDKLDTKVYLNSTFFCYISYPDLDNFVKDFSDFMAKYRIVLLFLIAPGFLFSQKIYTCHDNEKEIKYEIYDPISIPRFEEIVDSLMLVHRATEALSGCRWIEQPYSFNINGGVSDCSCRQITIFK